MEEVSGTLRVNVYTSELWLFGVSVVSHASVSRLIFLYQSQSQQDRKAAKKKKFNFEVLDLIMISAYPCVQRRFVGRLEEVHGAHIRTGTFFFWSGRSSPNDERHRNLFLENTPRQVYQSYRRDNAGGRKGTSEGARRRSSGHTVVRIVLSRLRFCTPLDGCE
jgi:hypothetical protein